MFIYSFAWNVGLEDFSSKGMEGIRVLNMYSKRFVSKVSCPDMCVHMYIEKESILKKIFKTKR